MRTNATSHLPDSDDPNLIGLLLLNSAFIQGTILMAGQQVRNVLPPNVECRRTFAHAVPFTSIAASLCSRLVLNLYEAATPDHAGSDSCPEPMTTIMLTTRVELGTDIDDGHIDSHQ